MKKYQNNTTNSVDINKNHTNALDNDLTTLDNSLDNLDYSLSNANNGLSAQNNGLNVKNDSLGAKNNNINAKNCLDSENNSFNNENRILINKNGDLTGKSGVLINKNGVLDNNKKGRDFFSLTFIKDLKWYEWLIIIVMSVAQLCVAIFSESSVGTAIFNYSISIAGFLYLVCASHCSFWIFIFGLYQPIAYGIVCLNAQVYGEMIVNFAYFAPMQIIGIILWIKNARAKNKCSLNSTDGERSSSLVEIKTLKLKQYLWFVPVLIAVYLVMYFVLTKLNGQRLPFLDALISVGYILGTLLLTLRYVENWYVYLFVNILSCVLWIILALQGNGDALYIFILDIAYLLYSIIGLIKWRKLVKSNTATNNNSDNNNSKL